MIDATEPVGDRVDEFLEDVRARVDAALDTMLPMASPDPGRVCEAMRYAVLSGGKRIRPAVTIASARALGADASTVMAGACAIELVHAYSLVHDDLPAMDDDTERRGRPTVHVEFGEWNAILTGDALLTRAFGVLADADELPAERRIRASAVLASEAGAGGMVGGQALDLELGQAIGNLDDLERVHGLKTGALYGAAAEIGAVLAGADSAIAAQFQRWGRAFGIAFQHVDDVLDEDQPGLREAARGRVEVLCDECREFALGHGHSGRALEGLAGWIHARARSAG